MTAAVALLYLLVLAVLFVNGWTDAPNAIASAVGSGAMDFRRAAALAAGCNFAGSALACLLFPAVAATMGGLVSFSDAPAAVTALGAAMLSVVLWAVLAWRFGLPTSESHALLSGLSGAALALGPHRAALQAGPWLWTLAGLALSLPAGALAARLFRRWLTGRTRSAAAWQRRAAAAIAAGYFKAEILPVQVKEKKTEFTFDTDEFVKPNTTMEVLAKLRPIVKPDGTVTAGNSCGLNDGAAALVLMSEKKVRETGMKPRARILDVVTSALDPAIMGYGPYYATHKILERTGMDLSQIDLVELNEAFASQSVACIRDLGLDPAKVNINGGAIALGHPLGCTGARLIVTLLHNLERTGGKYGLATLCIGGGQAMATILERLD